MSGHYSGPSAAAGAGQDGYDYGDDSYEMHPQPQSQAQQPSESYQPQQQSHISQPQFLQASTRLQSAIAALRGNIQQLRQVQRQAVASATPAQYEEQIESSRSRCRADNDGIQSLMQSLFADAGKVPPGPQREMMQTHLGIRKREWKEATTELLNAEREYDHATREGAKREYRIVHPEVDEREAGRAVEEGWGEGGAFQQALVTGSAKTAKAQSSLRALQSRGRQLQIIAQSIAELNDMFRYMDDLVMQQDYAIQTIEQTVGEVNQDLERGTGEQDTAIKHLKSRNKYRRWCILVTILIILAIALGVGLGIGLTKKSTS